MKEESCKVCGKKTNIIFNINLKKTPICNKCSRSIAYQEIADMFEILRVNSPTTNEVQE